MDENAIELFRRAGSISSEARELGASMIDEGVRLVDIADEIEALMRRKGARPSFPTNISINDIAAHYTPKTDDRLRFKRGDVVKLDCGAHIDGHLGDTSLTVEVGTNVYGAMIEAVREALDKAIDIAGAGVPVCSIGAAIQSSIEASGYKPVSNLTGHGISRYNLHTGLTVPNVDDGNMSKIEDGTVIAIEPFATDGEGKIKAGKAGNIYRVLRERPLKDEAAMGMFRTIVDEFGTLPFCERWCTAMEPKAPKMLNVLMRHGLISSYSTLKEVKKGYVSQWEHTLLIRGNKAEVLTR